MTQVIFPRARDHCYHFDIIVLSIVFIASFDFCQFSLLLSSLLLLLALYRSNAKVIGECREQRRWRQERDRQPHMGRDGWRASTSRRIAARLVFISDAPGMEQEKGETGSVSRFSVSLVLERGVRRHEVHFTQEPCRGRMGVAILALSCTRKCASRAPLARLRRARRGEAASPARDASRQTLLTLHCLMPA